MAAVIHWHAEWPWLAWLVCVSKKCSMRLHAITTASMPFTACIATPNTPVRALFLLVLMLAPSLPWAAELGDAPLGSSCRSAADAAVRAGAEPRYDIERMLHAGFVLLERGEVRGEREQILYRCNGSAGVLAGYSIELSTPSEATARGAYASALRALQGRYGRPTRNSEWLSVPQRMVRWRPYAAAFTADESSVWTGAAAQLISVTLEKQRTAPDWEVITSAQPAVPPASLASSRGGQLIGGALLVALCSATVVSALLMMPHVRYRWIIALATPLALTYELSCAYDRLARSLPGHAEGGAATWSAVWLICGAAASALVAWRWRQRVVARVPAVPVGVRKFNYLPRGVRCIWHH